MEYKGYYAKVTYDVTEKIFVGEVTGIKDSLNFHAENEKDIEKMFHQCIDNYLELCAKIKKTPYGEIVL